MSEVSAVIPAQAGIQENDLPKGWQLVELEKICTVDNGRGFKKTEWKSEGLPIIRIQNLKDDEADFNYFAGELDDKHKVKAGDLLFAWSGTPGTSFGAHIWHGSDAALNQHIFNVRFDKEKVDPKYFYFALNQNVARYVAQAQGGVGLAHITKGKFMASKIPLMSVEQQKRIVAKIEELFSHIDAGIEALKKAKQLLKQYRQSVLKAAVTGELTKEWRDAQGRASVAGGRKPGATEAKHETAQELLEHILKERREKWEEQQLEQFKAKGKMPKGDKWKEKYKEPELGDHRFFSDIPDDWSAASIDQLTWDVRYGSSSKTNENEMGVPVLRMGNIVDGQLDYTDLKYLPKNHDEFPDLLLEDGDLLFNRTNSAELVGKTAVFRDIGRQASLASYLIRVRVVSGVEPDFAAYFINSSCGRNWIKSCVSQNVGQANVNGTKLKALAMPLPSSGEQKEIVRVVEEKMQSSDRLLAEIDYQLLKVEKNKQSILASAFIGRIE
ncbi:MAG: restriction endonuclease subunit S [Candidatus Thiodiazotropha sp.]